jgi:DNA-directed RNA polymerase specialized sigma24 family protein
VKNSIDQWIPYKDMMYRIAADYIRKYPMVEADDLEQEMYLWFVTHPKKFHEWLQLEQKDSDKLIAKSLRNHCLKFCEKERARARGYDITDIYYYDSSVVEAVVPSIISESYEMPAKIKDLGKGKQSTTEISDGMNWLALRSDIASAYYKLSDWKQETLKIRFAYADPDWVAIGNQLGTTEGGARMKVQRIITNIIQNLGGWRPFDDKDTEEKEPDTSESELSSEEISEE